MLCRKSGAQFNGTEFVGRQAGAASDMVFFPGQHLPNDGCQFACTCGRSDVLTAPCCNAPEDGTPGGLATWRQPMRFQPT